MPPFRSLPVAGRNVKIHINSSVEDFTTRAMFEEMVASEEEHVDFFETQLETIEQVGLQLYLSQQIRD